MMASAALIVVGMGSSCPGTGSKANFDNPILYNLKTSVPFNHYWNAPMFFDLGAVDLSSSAIDLNNNIYTDNTQKSFYPMSIFHDADSQFYSVFTRAASSANPTSVYPYATQLPSITAATWVSSNGDFTALDTTATDTERSLTTVDAQGNITTVNFASTVAEPHYAPRATRHSFDSGAWTTPVDISSNGAIGVGVTGDALESAAIGSDANGDAVVAWAQPDTQPNVGGTFHLYFNEFRPNIGWRFPNVGAATAFTTWESGVTTAVFDRGVDLGFDAYGNGYGAYVGTVAGSTQIVTARWRSDLVQHFSTTAGDFKLASSGASSTPWGYPKLVVLPNGSATVFWYGGYNSGVGAELWYATTSANSSGSSGSFSAPVRLDSIPNSDSFNPVYMQEPSQTNPVTAVGTVYPPAVAVDGSQGVVAYIKIDSSTRRRIWVHNNAGTWTYIGHPDSAGSTDVTYVDVAINQEGTIAVVYSAVDLADSREHVYGNVYKNGSWQGVTQLDVSTQLQAGVAYTQSYPKVSIDEDGNAVCVYSMSDNLFTPSARRAVANIYR